ncbi:MAG: DeoR/GlpR transcriptional regulator [Lachnospiraceae bacterium]|nr:DeoR/GlpR transcriptional regulator [Lachnospiraceae bacterium]
MNKQLTAERRNQLAQILLSKGSIKVGEISREFGVSTETIRKDIIYLEKEGIAQKSHGGATITTSMLERPVDMKKMENTAIKTRISTEALSHIPENGTVILDAGSTNYILATLLSLKTGLTIFTNSILALEVLLNSENKVFAFGGLVRSSSRGIIGKWANEELRSIHADVSFIGTDGFLGLNGPATASYEEAEFKKNIIDVSQNSYILTDSTKFHSRTLFEFCHWKDITCLITDADAPADALETIRKSTEIITV